jgi:hypothetical protein
MNLKIKREKISDDISWNVLDTAAPPNVVEFPGALVFMVMLVGLYGADICAIAFVVIFCEFTGALEGAVVETGDAAEGGIGIVTGVASLISEHPPLLLLPLVDFVVSCTETSIFLFLDGGSSESPSDSLLGLTDPVTGVVSPAELLEFRSRTPGRNCRTIESSNASLDFSIFPSLQKSKLKEET